jgi:hypothetical protein
MMNSKKFLKLASIFDKQGNYKTSDLVYKFVEAQTDNLDEDPLGISDIQPTRMKDDPIVDALRKKVTSGEISEIQFWAALEKYKPGTFQNMLSNVGRAGEGDVDKIERNIASQGVRVAPKERDILAQFYEISNDVFNDFINSLQADFASTLRTMARKNELPEMFLEINEHRAGNLIMELIEPSTKEEFLTREYLELTANGIGISNAVEIGTDGDFSDINEYLKSFVKDQAPSIAAKASRVTGLEYHPEDIERKVQDVTIDTLNETLDNALTELYYVYKG